MEQQPMSELQLQYLQKIFGEPCYSGNQQFINLVSEFDPLTKNPILDKAQKYSVKDKTTMKQLKQKWYKKNVVYDHEQNNSVDKYVLMYGEDFPLMDQFTVKELKTRLGVQILDRSTMIRVYYTWDCPYEVDEAAMSYEKFQEKHCIQIDVPIKIQLQKGKFFYFYLKLKSDSSIQTLRENVIDELNRNSTPIQYDKSLRQILWVQISQISPALSDKINKLGFVDITKIYKNTQLFITKQIDSLKVREVCAPGELINLTFEQKNFKYTIKNIKDDFLLKITCYQRKDQEEEIKLNKITLPKKVISRYYSEISKMKVSTLLREQNVQDPLLTSLYVNGEVIRPQTKFEQIPNLSKHRSQDGSVSFICIPQNFLYYQELNSIAGEWKKSMKELLDQIPKKSTQMASKITETSRKDFENVRDQRLQKLRSSKTIDEMLKSVDFIDPIMIYTSNMVYYYLNQFLRETSISLFDRKSVKDQYWHYPISQKILRSLERLPNFHGTVFRGSGQYQYNFVPGTVIQWNCFTSTSKNSKSASNFLRKKKSPYLFEIRTFSGKQIQAFSYFQFEAQVLLLPYTKFKVLEVINQPIPELQLFDPITKVKLLEIPIPKSIPGHIVVWIDKNIWQNSKYFNNFLYKHQLKNFDVIYLESNQHFIMWLNQFKHILELPNVKIHFITNMNRSQQRKGEGVQTLQIIRSFDSNAKVVFFIGNKQATWEKLAGKKNDKNIAVISSQQELQKIFIQDFLDEAQRKNLQNLPVKSTNLPTKSTNLPTKSTNLPTKSTNLPVKSTNLPVKSTNLPVKSTKNESTCNIF